jgi:predicted O-methyltransferase YrrM
MKNNTHRTMKLYLALCLLLAVTLISGEVKAQTLKENSDLDKKAEKFLEEHAGQWYNMNVPTQDGKLLYDLIIKGNYKSALEIGTSTGHSGIYIAWALSKTGGKLITIDINESSHNTAVKNFKEAGLSDYIDARLADAHTLVKELEGPFDFVFSDADKNWYKNYFMDIDPKLIVGGCYTTHNIRDGSSGGRRGGGGSQEYLEYIKSLDNYESTLNSAGGGVLISYKRAE